MARLSRLFSRTPASPHAPQREGDLRRATVAHFSEFVQTRVGVEAYIEPPNQDTGTTLMLIATTGEWTRRRVPDETAARKLAVDLNLPVYDVRFVGYPQRMRDWNSNHRRARS